VKAKGRNFADGCGRDTWGPPESRTGGKGGGKKKKEKDRKSIQRAANHVMRADARERQKTPRISTT